MNQHPWIETIWETPPLVRSCLGVSLGAFAALAAALGFEHLGGYAPCPLCLIERIAYYAAVLFGSLALILAYGGRSGPARALLMLVALGFLINAGLGLYHSGVEWKWWAGPATCSGGAGGLGINADDLMQSLEHARVIRCDEAPWRFIGLSFAGWSGVISVGLAAIGLYGAGPSRGNSGPAA